MPLRCDSLANLLLLRQVLKVLGQVLLTHLLLLRQVLKVLGQISFALYNLLL